MKSSKRVVKKISIIAMTVAVMLLFSACAGDRRSKEVEETSEKYAVPQDNQLIVYTSHKEEVYLPIIHEFEARTGIWVDVHAGGTAEMMQQAREAAQNGQCDIMFGGGIESYEAQKDLFLPYQASEKDKLDTAYISKDDVWTAFTELPIVFIYNKKLVSPSDAPRTWSALFDEKWKGKIAFADVNNSGTSYTIISTMEQIFGQSYDELVPRLCEQLDGNILSSSGDVIPCVSDGEYLIGITLEETAKKYIDLGYEISIVYPEDGTSAVPDGCAIVRNAKHTYNAGKFIDFVVGYDTQQYAIDNFYRRSVRTDIDTSSLYGQVTVIDFDVIRSAREEQEVFALWDEIVGTKED